MRGSTVKLRADGIINVWESYERKAITIAEAYDISPGSVYAVLKAYCLSKGWTYEDYLRFPHKPHKVHVFKVKRLKIPRKPQIRKERKRPVRMPMMQYGDSFETDINFLIELVNSANSEEIDILIEATEMLINNIENTLAKGEK